MFNRVSWDDTLAGGNNDNHDDNESVGADNDEHECGGVNIFVFTILCAFNSFSWPPPTPELQNGKQKKLQGYQKAPGSTFSI